MSNLREKIFEFFSVYGWIIFIVVVMIGGLWYFGLFGRDNWHYDDCDKFCESVNTSGCYREYDNYVLCYVDAERNMTVRFNKDENT
jgi:hypothetical protein